MGTLGDLERQVMEILWSRDRPVSAYELQEALTRSIGSGDDTPLATTTVLTVLSRLEKKRFVSRDRGRRPHLFSAAASREDHVAELMHEVLGGAADRTAVLERFIGQASASEAATLRELLGRGGR